MDNFYSNIKTVAESDLPACIDVIHRSFATVAAEFGLNEQNCPTNGAFIPLTRLQNDYNKGDTMFGLYECGMLVGFMQLSKKDDGIYALEKLGVLPEHRHNGYGKKLIQFAARKVCEFDGNKISIGIIEQNTQLKNWYAANGFIHTGIKVFGHLPFTVRFMEMPIHK